MNPKSNPLDPNNMQIATDSSGLPRAYQYTDANGKLVTFDPKDIVYFRKVNPKNWFEGLSHIKTASYWTNAYTQGAQYNQNKLGNNVNADKFIVFEGIQEEEQKKVEAQLANKYSGPRNAGRTGVLAKEPKIIDMSTSPRDLDYVNGMKMLRQDILASFGIPEALFFPSATNSNTRESRILFQGDTIEPLLQQEVAVYNEQLIPKVTSDRRPKLHFIFDNTVDPDIDALINQAVKLSNAGILTRNETLQYIGKEQIPGPEGDIYINASPEINLDEDFKALQLKTKNMTEQLNRMLEKSEREEFITKNIKLANDQEGIMYAAAYSLFTEQFARAIENIDREVNPSARNILDKTTEVEATKQAFTVAYTQVLENSNSVGNTEIQQKLFKVGSPKFASYRAKSISGEAISAIAKRVGFFADEITDTSLKRLRKAMAVGAEAGFDKTQFKEIIRDIFNQFIDGQKNIDVLLENDFYIEAVGLTEQGGTVISSSNRYNAMLERITRAQSEGVITKVQMDKNLRALKGIIDPSDPIGQTVDNLLSSIYGISDQAKKGISDSRIIAISRTESTYARNVGLQDTYESNPFVKGKTWRAIHDSATRPSHVQADGQKQPLDEPFEVGGDLLMFPGDGSLGAGADEIVNCRCRLTADVVA